MGSYLYLVDPANGERLKKAIATPGKVYDMYDERRGSEKRVGQWRRDPDTGEEERIYDGEEPSSSVFGGALRGLKQGAKTAWDSVTHGFPAMMGGREELDAFHKLQAQRQREYETETPLHEQSADARDLFGDDGYLSLARTAKLSAGALPFLLQYIGVQGGLGIARAGAGALAKRTAAAKAATNAPSAALRIGDAAAKTVDAAAGKILGGQGRRGAIAAGLIGPPLAAQEAISTTEDQVPFSSPDVQKEAGLGAFSASLPFHLASGTLMSPLFGRYSKAGLPRAVAEAATEFVEGGADEFARQHGTNPLTGQDYDLRAIANAAGLEAVGGFGSSVLAKGLWSVVEPKEKKLRSAADGDAKKQVEIMNAMVNPLDPTVPGAKDTVQRGTNARAVAALTDHYFPAEKLDGPAQQNASDMFSQIVKFTGNDKLHGGNISETIMQMPREELFKSFPYLQDSGKNIRDDRDVVAAKNDLLKYTNAFLERSFPGADFLIRLLERSIKPENAREAAVYEILNQILKENNLEQAAVFGEGIDRYIKPGMTQKEQIDARAQAVNDLAVVSRRLEFDDVWEMWDSAYRKSPQVDSAIVVYDKSLQAGSPPFRAIRETQREDPKMREEEDKDDEIRMRNIQIALDAVRAKEEFDQQTMAGQSSARPQKFSDSAAEAAAETETAAEETAAEKPAAEEVAEEVAEEAAEEVEPPRTTDEIDAAAIEDTAISSALGGKVMVINDPFSVYPEGDDRHGNPFSIDPKSYQYKVGADAESGEVNPMDADYDPTAAGVLVAHERENGERFIAHGHHRNALAKRAAKAGKPAKMLVLLLREKDEVTIADAASWAGMQNLRDGYSSPLDVAKVLRNPKLRPMIERQLGARTGNTGARYRSAMGLAKLSEEAFGFATTQEIAPNIAAEVGHAGLDGANQMSVLQAFKENPPSGADTARMAATIAREGKVVGRSGAQGSFGGLGSESYKNEMLVKAELITKTRKSILSDAKAFSRVAGSGKEIGAVSDTETAEKITGGSESIRGKNKVMAAFLENSVGKNTPIYNTAGELARDIIAEKMTMAEAVKKLQADLSALYEKYGDKLAEDSAWEAVAVDAENAAVADDDAPPPVNENQGGIFSMSGLVGRSPREFAAQFPNQRTAKSRRADDDTAAEGDAYDQFVQRALEGIMETLYPKQGDRNSFRGANPAKQAFSALRRAGKGDVGRGMRSRAGGRKAEEARMAVAIFELVDAFERIGGIPANVAIYSMFEGGPKDQPFRNAVGHTDLENRIISIAMNSTEMTDDGEILIDNTDRKNNIGAVGLHEGWHLLWSILPPDTKKQIVADAKKWLDDIPPEIRRLIEESASRSGVADSDSVMADETVAYLLQTAFQTETPAAVRTDEGIIDRAKRRISQTRIADFLQGLFENGLPRPLITDSPVFRKFNDALVQAGKNWRRVGLLSSADVVNAFFGGVFAKQLELARAAGGRAAAMTSLRAAVRGAPKSEILRVFSPNELIISVGDDDDMQPDKSLPPRDSLGRFSLVVPYFSKTAESAVSRARDLWNEKTGGNLSREKIVNVLQEEPEFVQKLWRETGLIMGVDGQLRAEISDDWLSPNAAQIAATKLKLFYDGRDGLDRFVQVADVFPDFPKQLGKGPLILLLSQSLSPAGNKNADYRANSGVPTLSIETQIVFSASSDPNGAAPDEAGSNLERFRRVMIHELAHHFQHLGGVLTKNTPIYRNEKSLAETEKEIIGLPPLQNWNSQNFQKMVRQYMPVGKNKQNLDQASNLVNYWHYYRQFIEAEAREAENRMDRSVEWRAENPPSWDGIPVDKLTVGDAGRFSLVVPHFSETAAAAKTQARNLWNEKTGGDFSREKIIKVSQEDPEFVRKLWRETGLILGIDGKFRAEISDDWISPEAAQAAARRMADYYRGDAESGLRVADVFPGFPKKLGKGPEIQLVRKNESRPGVYIARELPVIEIADDIVFSAADNPSGDSPYAANQNLEFFRELMIHELAHYLQHIGDVLRHYSPLKINENLPAKAKEILNLPMMRNVRSRDFQKRARRDILLGERTRDLSKISGAVRYIDFFRRFSEAEAREVENRMNRPAEWRAQNPPEWDGIPVDKLSIGDYSNEPPERFSVISQTGIRPLRELQGMKAVRRGDIEKIIAGVQKAMKKKDEFKDRADLLRAAYYWGARSAEHEDGRIRKTWASAVERVKAQAEKTGETMADKNEIVGAVRDDLEQRAKDMDQQAKSAIFEKVYLEVLEGVLSELYADGNSVSHTPQQVWDAAAAALEKRNIRGFRLEDSETAHRHNVWDKAGNDNVRDVAVYDTGKNFDKEEKVPDGYPSIERHSHHEGDVFYFRVEEKGIMGGWQVLYGNIQSDVDDTFLTKSGEMMATRKNLARIMLSSVMRYHAEKYPTLPLRIQGGVMMDVAQGGELRRDEVVSGEDYPAAMADWEKEVAAFAKLERGDRIGDGVVLERMSDGEIAVIPDYELKTPKEFAVAFVDNFEDRVRHFLYSDVNENYSPETVSSDEMANYVEDILRNLNSHFDWFKLTANKMRIDEAADNITKAFVSAYKDGSISPEKVWANYVVRGKKLDGFDVLKAARIDKESFVSYIAKNVERTKDGKHALKVITSNHLVHKTKRAKPRLELEAQQNPHPKGTGNFGRFDWYENQIPRSAKELGVSVKRVPMTNSDNQTADAWEISAEDAAKVAGRPLEAFSIAAPPPRKRAGVTGADLYSALGSPPVVISLSSRRTGRIATKLLRGAGGAYFAGDDSRGRRWVADSLSRANVPPMMTAAAALEVARSFAKPAAVFADNGGGEVWEGKWAGRDGAGAPVLRGRWARDGKNRIVLESGAPGNAVFALAQAAQVSGDAIVVTPDMPPVRRALFDFGVRFFLRGGDLHIRRDALAFYANRDGMAWGTRTAAARRQAVRDNGRFSVFSQSGIRPLRALQGMNAVRRADIEKIIGSVRKTIKQKEEFGKRAGLFRAVRQSDGETKNPQEMKLWAGAMERAKAKAAKIGEKDFSVIRSYVRDDLLQREIDAEKQVESAQFERIYLEVLENVLSELYADGNAVSRSPYEVWDAAANALAGRKIKDWEIQNREVAHEKNVWDFRGTDHIWDVAVYDEGENFDDVNHRRETHHQGDVFYFRIEEKTTPEGFLPLYGNIQSDVNNDFLSTSGRMMATRKNMARIMLSAIMRYHAERYPNLPLRIQGGEMMDVAQGDGPVETGEIVSAEEFPAAMARWEKAVAEFAKLGRGDRSEWGVVVRRMPDGDIVVIPNQYLQRPEDYAKEFVGYLESQIKNTIYWQVWGAARFDSVLTRDEIEDRLHKLFRAVGLLGHSGQLLIDRDKFASRLATELNGELQSLSFFVKVQGETKPFASLAAARRAIKRYESKGVPAKLSVKSHNKFEGFDKEDFMRVFDIWKAMGVSRESFISDVAEDVGTSKDGYALKMNSQNSPNHTVIYKSPPYRPALESESAKNPHRKGTGIFGRFDWYENQIPRTLKELGVSVNRVPLTNSDGVTAQAWEIPAADVAKVAGRPIEAFSLVVPNLANEDKMALDGAFARAWDLWQEKGGEDLMPKRILEILQEDPEFAGRVWHETGLILGMDGAFRAEISDDWLSPNAAQAAAAQLAYHFRKDLGGVLRVADIFPNFPKQLGKGPAFSLLQENLISDVINRMGKYVSAKSRIPVIELRKEIVFAAAENPNGDSPYEGESNLTNFRKLMIHEIAHYLQNLGNITFLSNMDKNLLGESRNPLTGTEEILNLPPLQNTRSRKFQKQARSELPRAKRAGDLGDISKFVRYWDYLRSFTEAEAREAENRMDRSAEWRAKNPPSWDGVPIDKLLVSDFNYILPPVDHFSVAGRMVRGRGELRRTGDPGVLRVRGIDGVREISAPDVLAYLAGAGDLPRRGDIDALVRNALEWFKATTVLNRAGELLPGAGELAYQPMLASPPEKARVEFDYETEFVFTGTKRKETAARAVRQPKPSLPSLFAMSSAQFDRAQGLVNTAMRDAEKWARANVDKIIPPPGGKAEMNWLSDGRWVDTLQVHRMSVLDGDDKFTPAGIVGLFLEEAISAARRDGDDVVVDAVQTYRAVVRANRAAKNIFALIDELANESEGLTRSRRARRGRMARILSEQNDMTREILDGEMAAVSAGKIPGGREIISEFADRREDERAARDRVAKIRRGGQGGLFSVVAPPGTPRWWDGEGSWRGDSRLDGTVARNVLYHVTEAIFDDFLRSQTDGLVHFGNEDQAMDRSNALFNGEGELRLIPVRLAIKNPLRLEDVGVFDPVSVLAYLQAQRGRKYKTAAAVLNSAIREATDGWKRQIDGRDYPGIWADFARETGNDGFVYLNEVEGDSGDSYAVFSPQQIISAESGNTMAEEGRGDGRFSLVSPEVAGVADDAIRRAEKEWTARLGGDFSQKNIAVVLDEDDDFVERVWRDTGIILSVDGKYRAELRDDWITPSAVREMRDFFRGKRGGRWAGEAPITDFFPDAPSQLAEVEVSLGERGHGGSYSHDYKTINIKRGTMNRMDELISVLVHEVQHAWQSMLYGKGFGNWTKSSEDVRNMDDDDLRRAADAILAIVPSPDEKRAGGKIANVGRDVILETQRDLRVIKKHEDENGNKFAEKYADSRRSVLGDFYGYWAKFKETEAREVEARVGKDAKWRAENPPKYDGIPANLVVVGRLNPGGESAADYFYAPSGERVVKPKQEPERGQGGLFSLARDIARFGRPDVLTTGQEKYIAGLEKEMSSLDDERRRNPRVVFAGKMRALADDLGYTESVGKNPAVGDDIIFARKLTSFDEEYKWMSPTQYKIMRGVVLRANISDAGRTSFTLALADGSTRRVSGKSLPARGVFAKPRRDDRDDFVEEFSAKRAAVDAAISEKESAAEKEINKKEAAEAYKLAVADDEFEFMSPAKAREELGAIRGGFYNLRRSIFSRFVGARNKQKRAELLAGSRALENKKRDRELRLIEVANSHNPNTRKLHMTDGDGVKVVNNLMVWTETHGYIAEYAGAPRDQPAFRALLWALDKTGLMEAYTAQAVAAEDDFSLTVQKVMEIDNSLLKSTGESPKDGEGTFFLKEFLRQMAFEGYGQVEFRPGKVYDIRGYDRDVVRPETKGG